MTKAVQRRGARWKLTAGLGLLLASAASAQITNSAHDFSSSSWSNGETCTPCHTPHSANPSSGFLWNHTLTDATYLINGGKQSAALDIDVVSRLCLSCHDGTVALDSFGGAVGSTFMPARSNLGKDMRDDHPIGRQAQYPPDPLPAWWNTEFRDASGLPPALRLQNWKDPRSSHDPLDTKRVVGCATCHDPHNRGFPHLLTMSNATSAICLNCHLK